MDTSISRGRELIAAAVTWRDEGVSVVPAQPRSKAVMLRWRRYENNLPSVDLIRHWFSAGVMNLAAICGTGGLLVLDFDDLAKYLPWKEKAGDLAATYTESTGRGMHLFYRVDQPVTRRFEECEALGLGHLCLTYPSIHPTGAIYWPVGNLDDPIIQTKTSVIFSLLSDPKTQVENNLARETLNKAKPADTALSGDDLLSRIKAALPLVSYARSMTLLTPCGGNGRYLHGLCPFHEDKEPSFTVDAVRGLWRCYSPSCKGSLGGDVVNLYALASNVTIGEAIRRLAREVL